MSTNADLSKIITKFNNQKYKWEIKIILSDYIDYVKFHDNSYYSYNSLNGWRNSHDCFLLKKDNKYVGIIEDLGSDLHIYVQKKYRKKTNLISELNKTIIPFLLINRKEQKLTFINEKVEKYFLKNLTGIKSVKKCEAIIKNNVNFINNKEKNKFNEVKFDKFKKILLKIIKLERKIDRFFNNRLAGEYLKSQSYINDSDYNFLTEEEKLDFTKEDFEIIKKEINYKNKLAVFNEETLLLLYDDKKRDRFDNYIYDNSLKNIQKMTLKEFENI